MKYIILSVDEKNIGVTRAYPIVFPDRLVHSDVAKSMIHMIGFDAPAGHDLPKVLSAGFCSIDGGQFSVYEHGSESLKVKRDPACIIIDERILNMPECLQGMI